MLFVFCLLALISTCLAAETQGQQLFSLPKNIKNANFKYEGHLKVRDRNIPIQGKFHIRVNEDRIEMLDDANLELKGKRVNVKHWLTVDDQRQQLGYILINNKKCFSTEFSQEKGTFPHAGPWREIGNNKFERTIRNRFSVQEVVKTDLSKLLGNTGTEKHDVKMQIQLTFNKNKIQKFSVILSVDGEEVTRKVADVTEYIQGKVDESLFEIPRVCKQPNKMANERAFNVFLVILGIDMKGKGENREDLGMHNKGMQEESNMEEGKEAGEDTSEDTEAGDEEQNEAGKEKEGAYEEGNELRTTLADYDEERERGRHHPLHDDEEYED